jgi:hypothetical protein
MEEELNRQKHFKPKEADSLEHINPTTMREQADELENINPMVGEQANEPKYINWTIEADERDNERDDEVEMADLIAKLKLEREQTEEKEKKEGRRVQKEIKVVECCISCGKRIEKEGRCDECARCTSHGHQRTSREGKCKVCAKERCRKWLDELPS